MPPRTATVATVATAATVTGTTLWRAALRWVRRPRRGRASRSSVGAVERQTPQGPSSASNVPWKRQKWGWMKIVRLISGEAVAFRLKKCDRCCCQPRKGRERRIFPYVSLSFPSKFPWNHPLPMALQGGHNQDVNERPDWRRPLSASASTTASQSSYIRGLDSGGGPRFGMDAMQGMTIISVQVCRWHEWFTLPPTRWDRMTQLRGIAATDHWTCLYLLDRTNKQNMGIYGDILSYWDRTSCKARAFPVLVVSEETILWH